MYKYGGLYLSKHNMLSHSFIELSDLLNKLKVALIVPRLSPPHNNDEKLTVMVWTAMYQMKVSTNFSTSWTLILSLGACRGTHYA